MHSYLVIMQTTVADMCHSMEALSADKSNLEEKLAREEVETKHTHVTINLSIILYMESMPKDALNCYLLVC